jgi:hypothetical protein
LIGPGDPGPWSPERYSHDFALQGFVGRFAAEAQVGDIVLLRSGVSKVLAVGIIASEYLYLEQFDDVNGWDLQHARRIRWYELPDEYRFSGPVFSANPTRFSRVASPEVVDYARKFVASPPTRWQGRPLPALPEEEPRLDSVPSSLADIVAKAQDLAGLFWDRQNFGDHPSEDEMVAHLVVPFLGALGWPPEWIAIKWRHIDVAVFGALPRTPESCRFVIEAKRFGAGVEGALKQVKGYVQRLGVHPIAVVTDGVRYRMYSSERGFEPIAYANLIRLRQSATVLFSKMKRP